MCRCFYVSPITSYQHTHSYTYQHTLSHTPSHTHQHIVPTKPDLGIITIVFSELIHPSTCHINPPSLPPSHPPSLSHPSILTTHPPPLYSTIRHLDLGIITIVFSELTHTHQPPLSPIPLTHPPSHSHSTPPLHHSPPPALIPLYRTRSGYHHHRFQRTDPVRFIQE